MKKDIKAFNTAIHDKQKQLLTVEDNIGNLHRERRSILIHCAVSFKSVLLYFKVIIILVI